MAIKILWIWRLQNKVDIIVCDSPILLSTIYDSDDSDLFELYVLEQYKKYNNVAIENIKKYKDEVNELMIKLIEAETNMTVEEIVK